MPDIDGQKRNGGLHKLFVSGVQAREKERRKWNFWNQFKKKNPSENILKIMSRKI